ncbi:MAG: carbonic anhydrase [Gallionella sp.]|jgi:carbonic anhydrase|nr:carbonic anhydrase [Gallionella sp.]
MSATHELVEGFRRFRNGRYAQHQTLFEQLAARGQAPRILVVSCCDSRVDPAVVTDSAPGELFIIRNVANLVPPYERGGGLHGTSAALEFGVCELGVSDIIVLGHAHCGGVRALLHPTQSDKRQDGFINDWMRVAEHARNRVLARSQDISPDAQQRACEMEAIRVSLDNLLTFPWILERVMRKELRLQGWYFDMDKVELLAYDMTQERFELLA